MIEATAYIYYNEVKICKIIFRETSQIDFEYIFQPDYLKIASLIGFKGIQGLNLSLKKKEYIRKNIIPSFIYEHSPFTFKFEGPKCYARNRNGDNEFHYANDVNGIPLLDFLAQTEYVYFGDNLTIRKI